MLDIVESHLSVAFLKQELHNLVNNIKRIKTGFKQTSLRRKLNLKNFIYLEI